MEKTNVLIYPANGYAALHVYFCLKDNLRYYPIMGNHGSDYFEYVCDEYYSDMPLITDECFADYMRSFCREHKIKYIIPTHDSVVVALKQIEKKIGVTIVCSELDTCILCRHKSKTYERLQKFDFVPTTYKEGAKAQFPLFAKDDEGQGGKNSIIIYSEDELKKLKQQNNGVNYVLCEYLPGDEITVDCFTDRHGMLLYCNPRVRETVMNGISKSARFVELTDEIKGIAEDISESISFRGYWYFQCKRDVYGKYKLLEISTRFAGTFCLSKSLDVNLPVLALTDLDGIDVNISPNTYGIITDRFYSNRYKINYSFQNVYIDFDDTIAFQREICNPLMIAFIYQCLNKKKNIYLITKHAYDIMETLTKLHIDKDIFTGIIHVDENKKKTDYIQNSDSSIFIDNSYAERKDVKESLHMPTFDTCNIDLLLKMPI